MKFKYKTILSWAVFMPLFLLNAQNLEVVSYQEISNGLGGLPASTFEANGYMGSAIDSLGDFDGDGVEDFVVVTHQEDDSQANIYGSIYLVMMNADKTVKSSQKIANGVGGLPAFTTLTSRNFGFSVQTIGDIDSNGVVDIAVSSPEMSGTGVASPGNEPGAIFIFRLNADGTVLGHTIIGDGSAGFPVALVDDGDDFGSGMANVGDLDNDGIDDLMVSAPFWTDGVTSFIGSLFLMHLNSDGTLKSISRFPGAVGSPALNTFNANYGGHTYLGYRIANIGDLDLDGHNDVAVTQGSGDAVEIFFLNADGSLKSMTRIANGVGGLPAGTISEATYSLSVDGIADIDGDGVRDLLVGDEQDGTRNGVSGSGWRTGAVNVVYMNADGTAKGVTKIADGVNGLPSGSLVNSSYFSRGVASMGTGANGLPVIAVTEPQMQPSSAPEDRYAGGVWLLELGSKQAESQDQETPEPETETGETRTENRHYYANTIAPIRYELDETGFLSSSATFSGTLPTGLNIIGDVLQGFVSGVGNYTFQTTGTDGTNTLILNITVEVMSPTMTPLITGVDFNGTYTASNVVTAPTHAQAAVLSPFMATATVNEALVMHFYWDQIKGSDGFTIVGGSLPAGLVLDRANGTITGAPTDTGIFEFIISVKDWRGRGYLKVILTVEE